MTSREIEMCVLDCLQDDVENVPALLRMLNGHDPSSWEMARGARFTADEVQAALDSLMDKQMVTPYADDSCGTCVPVEGNIVGSTRAWEDVWFQLEPLGRDVFRQWWEAEGRIKYPFPRW